MEASNCQEHQTNGLGSWRCDFVIDKTAKLGNRNLQEYSPLAFQLVKSLKLPNDDPVSERADLKGAGIYGLIKILNRRLKKEGGAPEDQDDEATTRARQRAAIREVACDWVVSNWEGTADWSGPEKWLKTRGSVPEYADTQKPLYQAALVG